MLCVPCYVSLCRAHILEGLYDLISVESNRLLGIRIDSNRVDSSRFVKIFHLPAHLFATWLPVSRVPLNRLPVSRKSLILELTRIVFALRRFDSVWLYWTWVKTCATSFTFEQFSLIHSALQWNPATLRKVLAPLSFSHVIDSCSLFISYISFLFFPLSWFFLIVVKFLIKQWFYSGLLEIKWL